jgi:hypothetical protein
MPFESRLVACGHAMPFESRCLLVVVHEDCGKGCAMPSESRLAHQILWMHVGGKGCAAFPQKTLSITAHFWGTPGLRAAGCGLRAAGCGLRAAL